ENSTQTPGSVSSVYGFKPSVGMVSRTGVVPLVPSQDSPGPIAASVEDLALLLSVIAKPDRSDTASLKMRHDLSGPLTPRDPRRVRIGVPRRAMADRPDFADVMAPFEAALSRLSQAGIAVV